MNLKLRRKKDHCTCVNIRFIFILKALKYIEHGFEDMSSHQLHIEKQYRTGKCIS